MGRLFLVLLSCLVSQAVFASAGGSGAAALAHSWVGYTAIAIFVALL